MIPGKLSLEMAPSQFDLTAYEMVERELATILDSFVGQQLTRNVEDEINIKVRCWLADLVHKGLLIHFAGLWHLGI